MAQNIVFIVHGMGENFAAGTPKRETWDNPVVRALDDAWSSFPSLAGLPRPALIEYVPITYDQIFREYLSGISDAVQRLHSYMPAPELKDVFDVFQGANPDEANFFWSHIMDVLDYRYGAERFRYVHAHIARTIAEKANATWALPQHENATFSVLSHSLGTAAAHGALNRLGGGDIGHNAQFRLGGAFRIRSYISIANVSRVLWYGERDLYHATIVRPGTPALGPGYVDEFINVRHSADPIIAPKPFAPADWGPGYRTVPVRHVRSMNVHDLCHYLAHPSVSGSIFRSILGDAFLSEQAVNDAAAAFPDIALPDAAKRQQVEKLVDDMTSSLQTTYGNDQALLWSIPRLFALVLRNLYQDRQALRPLLQAT
jgi:hypothetical protein